MPRSAKVGSINLIVVFLSSEAAMVQSLTYNASAPAIGISSA